MENGKCVLLLLPPAPASCRLPFVPLPRRQFPKRPKVSTGWQAIIEAALHLPAPQIELPPRATIETGPVALTLAGKWPTHFPVPAAKQPGYPVSNSAPRRIALYNVRIIEQGESYSIPAFGSRDKEFRQISGKLADVCDSEASLPYTKILLSLLIIEGNDSVERAPERQRHQATHRAIKR
jgi:hypothetical protein